MPAIDLHPVIRPGLVRSSISQELRALPGPVLPPPHAISLVLLTAQAAGYNPRSVTMGGRSVQVCVSELKISTELPPLPPRATMKVPLLFVVTTKIEGRRRERNETGKN